MIKPESNSNPDPESLSSDESPNENELSPTQGDREFSGQSNPSPDESHLDEEFSEDELSDDQELDDEPLEDDLMPSAEYGLEDEDPEEKKARRAAVVALLKPRIVELIHGAKYRPMKPKGIAKFLGVHGKDKKLLKRAIYQLVRAGSLKFGPKHQILPGRITAVPPQPDVIASPRPTKQKTPPPIEPIATVREPQVVESEFALFETLAETPPPVDEGGEAPPELDRPKKSDKSHKADKNKGRIVGVLRKTASGAGFVRPKGVGKEHTRENDIFIPAGSSVDAADGDEVEVALDRDSGKSFRGVGRITGHVVRIVERRTHRFVGTYEERRNQGLVRVDGRTFAEPIPVGDPGAKGAADGDKVVVEMVRFPSPRSPGEAVLVEILGAKGEPGVDTLSIIHEFELPGDFSDEVLEDARQQADAFDESIGDRADFTSETVITIDPVDARDFDDAISLKKLSNGHWELGVHIADVSHFVRPKGPLDREARDRATSIYLPDRVIPMLPEVISNHLASLQPDRVRYTQTCFIEFTPEGVPVHAEVKRGAIRSCRRFAYEEVDEFLADRSAWKERLDAKVVKLLDQMHELAMVLRKRRLDSGAIELSLPEIKIDLDKQGKVSGAHLVKNTVSHQIIEEFMLAANEAVARILTAAELPFLRRVHAPPDPRKLDVLTGFVRELGIECDHMQSRFEIKRVVAAVADSGRMHAVNYAILRSMQKAVYSPEAEGHYALNSENYCHFTSPIRRYPDLTIHRMLEAIERGKRPHVEYEAQVVLGEHCSDRERRAEEAERELKKTKLLAYLETRIGDRFEAVITGVEDFGFFAQGTKLPAEGMVHVRTLADDRYRFDRETHSLSGYRSGNSFRLGDLVEVEVAYVNVERRELDFRFVQKLASEGAIELAPTSHEEDQPRGPRPRGKKGHRHEQLGSRSRTGAGKGKKARPTKRGDAFGKPQKGKKGKPSAKKGPPEKGKAAQRPVKKKQRPGKREREQRKSGP
jgi:ribonuclease R